MNKQVHISRKVNKHLNINHKTTHKANDDIQVLNKYKRSFNKYNIKVKYKTVEDHTCGVKTQRRGRGLFGYGGAERPQKKSRPLFLRQQWGFV